VRTGASPRPTLRLVGGGKGESGSALSIFGPVRAGLTITPTTPNQRRLVLLNALVKNRKILASKSSRDLGMCPTATRRLVGLGRSGSSGITTRGGRGRVMERDVFCCGGCGDQFWDDEGEVVKRDTLIEFTCHKCKSVVG